MPVALDWSKTILEVLSFVQSMMGRSVQSLFSVVHAATGVLLKMKRRLPPSSVAASAVYWELMPSGLMPMNISFRGRKFWSMAPWMVMFSTSVGL